MSEVSWIYKFCSYAVNLVIQSFSFNLLIFLSNILQDQAPGTGATKHSVVCGWKPNVHINQVVLLKI